MRTPERRVVLSCEHGGNRVPARHRARFAGQQKLLASHRGWDAGALAVARSLARAWRVPLYAATTTRLLVDLNRSPHNPAVFSAQTRGLPLEARAALLARHHEPHWRRVRAAIGTGGKPVLHLAVHSFTPVHGAAPRDFEIGILYDPSRRAERALAAIWQRRLREAWPGLRVRRNAPYRGGSDGLTTALRRELPVRHYLGLELELNQRAIATASQRRAIVALLASSLR